MLITDLLCKFKKNKFITNFLDWEKYHNKKNNSLKKEYFKKIFKYLNVLNNPHPGSVCVLNRNNAIIEVKNVSKYYTNKANNSFQRVLSNLHLTIDKGEFVVILGESGSGKTTLLNLLSGMERCSKGQIIVANHNLIAMNEKQLTQFRRKYISIIFQNYSLIPDLSVSENVNFGSELQEDARKRIELEKLYKLLDIETQKYKMAANLSGGQQQRASILKALAKTPNILFADEPTGAVDINTCKNILTIFQQINKLYETTIILITHNISIAHLATKVIYINKGFITRIKTQKPKTVDQVNWANDY